MANPNPNEPNFPYSGGTDNPGDDTSKPGGPTGVASTETAPLSKSGSWTQQTPSASLTASVERHPPLPAGLAQGGTDTVLPPGVQAVPPAAAGFESLVDRGADPEGGVDPVSGSPREAGQDETAGATETTSGVTPAAFPQDVVEVPLSEITLGSGWSLLAGSLVETGPTATVYLQLAFGAGASAVAATLPQSAWPKTDVVSNNGLFTIDAEDGTITYSGSTASPNPGPVVCEADSYDPYGRH